MNVIIAVSFSHDVYFIETGYDRILTSLRNALIDIFQRRIRKSCY